MDDELGSDLDVVEPVFSAIAKDAVYLALSPEVAILVLASVSHADDEAGLARVAGDDQIPYV